MAGKVLNISLNATITPLQKALESVGKMMNDFAASIEKTDKKMADSIRTNVADMNASLDKVKQSFVNTEKAGDNAGKNGTTSLRTQLRQATQEAQMLAETVGTTDPKFIAAASKAAELKDKIGDTQLAIDALNPDEKFKGIANLMGGITKAGAGLQGAMNAFGVESEDAAKAMAKLQGLMAMSEGFNALGGLVDVLGSIKTQVIAAAQSMGTLKFAIAATGIGALVIAVGLLATHWDEVSLALSDASLKTEMLADKQKKLAEDMDKAAEDLGNKNVQEFEKQQKYFNRVMDYKVREIQKQKELAEAKGASAKVILDLDLKILALEKERSLGLAKAASTNLALIKTENKYKDEAIEIDHQRQVLIAQYNKKLQEQAEALKKAAEEEKKASLADKAKQLEDRLKSMNEYSKQEFELKKQTGLTSLQIDAEFEKIRKENKLLNDSEILQSISKRYEDEKKLQEDLTKTEQQAQIDKAKRIQENQQQSIADYNFRVELAKKLGMTLVQLDDEFEKVRVANTKLNNEQIYAQLEKTNQTYIASQKLATDATKALNDALKSMAAEGIAFVAESIGTALAGGAITMADVFNGLISIVADTASQLGKQFIAMGLASYTVQTSIFQGPQGALLAVAAGAALVAASAAAKAVIKNMGAKKMEQGGLVYGNSFVNVGEYGNAHTNPEVIAPLSKLKDMIGGSNTQRVMVEGRLYGSQLAMASSRSQSVIKRVTGRR